MNGEHLEVSFFFSRLEGWFSMAGHLRDYFIQMPGYYHVFFYNIYKEELLTVQKNRVVVISEMSISAI